MKTGARQELVSLPIATRDGQFIARYSARGLAGLDFPSKRSEEVLSATNETVSEMRRWHRASSAALKRALSGRVPRVLPPLDLSAGTAFQQRVWSALLKIPRGQTRSYGEVARMVRQPRATRAVGAACGANPIPVFVPCHRVLAANHKLGGFSSGLDWKKKLLWREEVRDWWG